MVDRCPKNVSFLAIDSSKARNYFIICYLRDQLQVVVPLLFASSVILITFMSADHSMQVLLLIAMPLAVAVVVSFLTMLGAEELSPLSSAAQIVELESIAANTVKMLESDAQVACAIITIIQR